VPGLGGVDVVKPLDVDLLLSTGAMLGPYKRTRAATRATVAARRAYRALALTVQTLALLLRANRRGK
jgi:hypothetical protein